MKCPNHEKGCGCTGAIVDCEPHWQSCISRGGVVVDKEERNAARLEEKNYKLKRKAAFLHRDYDKLKMVAARREEENDMLKRKVARLGQEGRGINVFHFFVSCGYG